MNKDNILAVADAIEKRSIPGLSFGMGSIHTCIECWAYHVAGKPPTHASHIIERGAHDFLDIKVSSDISTALFGYLCIPVKSAQQLKTDADRHAVTAERAVAVLRHLAETGEVDWSKAA